MAGRTGSFEDREHDPRWRHWRPEVLYLRGLQVWYVRHRELLDMKDEMNVDGGANSGAAAAFTPAPGRGNAGFEYFLDLPFDIRNMIYSLLLVRGTIFISGHDLDDPNANTHPFHSINPVQNKRVFNRARGLIRTRCLGFDRSFDLEFDGKTKVWNYVAKDGVTLGLVQGVSRLVQEEAEAVLWGARNEFVLPIQKIGRPLELWDGGAAGTVGVLRKIKRVNLALDFQDLGRVGGADQGRSLETTSHFVRMGDFYVRMEGFSSEMDVKRAFHRHLVHRLCEFWRTRLDAFTQISSLHSLKLDVDECFCPFRCCRLAKTVLKSKPNSITQAVVHQDMNSSKPPRSVEIFGTADKEERELALQYFEERGVLRSAVSFTTAFVDYPGKDHNLCIL